MSLYDNNQYRIYALGEWGILTNDSPWLFTFDKDSGVSLIVSYADDSEIVEGINIQSLGIINTFLNLFNTYSVEPVNEIEQEPTEHISLKDYYRLNLPDNKIGRKSDETLIKELEEAGFKV